MFKVGDVIPCKPSVESSRMPTEATVVSFHPAGRFYTVRFDCRGGSFLESFPFKREELEELYDLGVFKRPVEVMLDESIYNKSKKKKENNQQMQDFEGDFYVEKEQPKMDISTLMAML